MSSLFFVSILVNAYGSIKAGCLNRAVPECDILECERSGLSTDVIDRLRAQKIPQAINFILG